MLNNSQEVNSQTSNTTTDMFAYFLVAAVIFLICVTAMLPATLTALLFLVIFINMRQQGIWFSIISIIVGCLLQFLTSLKIQTLLIAIASFIKTLPAVIKSNNMAAIKNYYLSMSVSNALWQFIIGIFAAGILTEIYYMNHFFVAPSLDEKASMLKQEKQGAKNKKKQSEKVAGMRHPEEETIIGTDTTGKAIKIKDKAKHIFIPGTTGSGKTVALSNFIESAFQKNYGILAVDGKGDTGSGSMYDYFKKFSQKFNRKLHIINLKDVSGSGRYNPFAGASGTVAKDMLMNMSDWSEEHYKSNTERYIERVIKHMNLANIPLSFLAIIEYMNVEKFEDLSMQLVKSQTISKIEHIKNLELTKESGNIANAAAARFATIAESEVGAIFAAEGTDIYNALSNNEAILFILDPLSYPVLSPALGRLILIDAKKAISKFFGQQAEQRKFFIFDEINVYASPVLIDLVNKSRSAGVTAIMATQSLADLENAGGAAFKQQVIECSNNYIIMRQNSPQGAEELANVIGTRQTMDMTYQIQEGRASGMGSARAVREFKYHPDDIKSLKTGEGIYCSKDEQTDTRVFIRKPM